MNSIDARSLLGPLLADPADVADPAVLQLPDRGDLDVEPEPLVFSDPFGAGGEVAGREQPRGRGRADDEQVRQERALLLLAQELLGRGDQLAPRGDLGPVVRARSAPAPRPTARTGRA